MFFFFRCSGCFLWLWLWLVVGLVVSVVGLFRLVVGLVIYMVGFLWYLAVCVCVCVCFPLLVVLWWQFLVFVVVGGEFAGLSGGFAQM